MIAQSIWKKVRQHNKESKSIGEINDDADMSEAQKIRAMGDKLSAIFGNP